MVWICSGMRQAPFSLVDRGCSFLIKAWASVFMNNRCPVLVKRMTPVVPCCCGLFDCLCPLRGSAGFSVAVIDMCSPSSCTSGLFEYLMGVKVALESASGPTLGDLRGAPPPLGRLLGTNALGYSVVA